jgi:hypothetical protein
MVQETFIAFRYQVHIKFRHRRLGEPQPQYFSEHGIEENEQRLMPDMIFCVSIPEDQR